WSWMRDNSEGNVSGDVVTGDMCGTHVERCCYHTPLRIAGTMALCNLVIYTVCVPWLMAAGSFELSAGLTKGVAPFLIGDVVKIVIAAGLLPATWALVRRIRGTE